MADATTSSSSSTTPDEELQPGTVAEVPITKTSRPNSVLRKQLFVLALFTFGETITWSNIFLYIYAMVRSFPATRVDDTNVATYAGLEIAAFTLGQGIAAPIWARISDSIGRKPTLILANLLTIPGVLLFGCSTSLSMSIFTRFWAGLSNPNVGLVQTFVGEMASMEQQSMAFSSIGFYRTLGNILGPPVGGYLSEPVLRYSFLFKENSVWDKFPYLLPNVFCALILFASVLFGLFFLEEVHPRLRHQPDISTRLLIWGRNLFHQEPFHVLDNHYSALNANDIDLEELSNVPNEESYKLAASESPPFNRRLAFTPQVRLQILSFAFFIYMRISLLAIEPVYFEYPYHTSPSSSYKLLHVIFGYPGGFGLSTTATSNILLTQAAATMLSQWFLVPQIIDRFGSLRSYKFVLGGFLGTYAVCPMVTGFPWWLGMIIIVPVMWFYSLINTLGTTAQSIMITRTAPDPVYLATINGAAVTLGCLSRTVGPAITGALFKLGLKWGYVGVSFYSMGLVVVMAFVVVPFLRDHP